jgi:hypothetical protein
MKKLSWLIIASLIANVVLAGIYLKRHDSSSTQPTGLDSAKTAANSHNKISKRKRDNHSARNVEAQSQNSPEITKWKNIQSDDLKDFIRRLREAGCPEETIRDIIVAEVNRIYAKKTRELWPDRYEVQPFWKVQKHDAAEQKKNRERWRQEQDLRIEKSALLVALLGIDPEKQQRLEEGMDEPIDWRERQIAFLPEHKRADVLKILDEWQDRQQEMHERNRGLWDAQSRAEQREMEQEKMKALAQVLTPQELREYELRQSQTASQLSHDLRNLDITRDQYETIFDIRKKYGDSIYNYGGDDNTKEQRDKIEENKKAMKEELASALGGDLVKQYERSQDYSFQELSRLAKRYDLPADTANKVYDYKETAEASVKQLRDDKNMSDEQRQTALQKVREETEKTLKEALGEKNYNRYLSQGGWWLRNLAPTPPKPKTAGTSTTPILKTVIRN